MDGKSLLINFVGELPIFKIIDFLLENKGLDFSKKDIAEGANISRASLFNYWQTLDKYQIVKATRKFGQTTLFTLNTKSLIAKKIIELEKALISEALEKRVSITIKH
jgi:hypothetical protein